MTRRIQAYLLGAALLVLLAVVLLLWQPWASESGEYSASAAEEGRAASSTRGVPSTEMQGILATTDLAVGSNRIAFLLGGPDGFVTNAEAEVSTVYLPAGGSPSISKETATARFHLWPFGTRASYTTQLQFDEPGDWRLDVRVEDAEGHINMARIPLTVKEASTTPAIGSQPPLTQNKTLRDVTSLKKLTSASAPDPDLYEKTIAEAIASGKPLVLVFASPAFCTSPTCGPQVETIQKIKESYRGQANFIHVEVYDNPEEVRGGLDKGRYAPVVEAWKLNRIEGYVNESWVFLLDRQGRIAAKYQGFAAAEELEEAVLKLLR